MNNNDNSDSGRGRGRGYNRGGQNNFRGGLRRGQANYRAPRGRYSSSPVKRGVHFESSSGDSVHRRLGLRRSTGSIRSRLQARSSAPTTSYVNYNRRRRLNQDGEDLPTAIGFDVEESVPVPSTLPSHLPEDVAKFATDFVAQFYTLYDSSDRQKLIDGYHEQASFSFSIMKSLEREQTTAPFPRELIEESRNLARLTNPEGWNKLLRQGKVAVVAAINSLPETTHIKESLVVDVPFYSNVLVHIVVSGLFVEVWRRQKKTRTFARTFFIVPQEGGYFIVNDLFMVGNSTHSQRQKFPASSVNSPSPSSSTLVRSSGDSDDSTSLISKLTGMNMKMSKQLLDESNQNVETALTMFKELNDRGAIPAEAFK